MSFRQYGGINYAARNNIVKNNYTNANNLSVMTKVGQPSSIINVESGLYGIAGDITFQQLGFPKYGIMFSDGSFQNAAVTSTDSYWVEYLPPTSPSTIYYTGRVIVGADPYSTGGSIGSDVRLAINGGTAMHGNLYVANGDSSNAGVIYVTDNSNNTLSEATLRIVADRTNGANYIQSGKTNVTGSVADLYFTGMNASGTIWMTIKADGKVGIGTTSPAYTLDVSGDALINGLTVGRGSKNVLSNTVVGSNALNLNTTGTSNVAIGFQSLLNNTTGIGNTALGYQALYFDVSGNYNTAVGTTAMYNYTASGTAYANTAIGHAAMYSNVSGLYCTAVGYRASYYQMGGYNTSLGFKALLGSSTVTSNGTSNCAIGDSALEYNTSGSNNVAVGHWSLLNNTTGSNNVAIGSDAGKNYTSCSNNTYIGCNTDCSANNLSNSTAIGYNSVITANNQIMMGTASETVKIPGGLQYSSAEISVSTINLSLSTIKQFYFVNDNSFPIYIYLPNSMASPANDGITITFRRLYSTNSIIITPGTINSIYDYNGTRSTTSSLNISMTTNEYTCTLTFFANAWWVTGFVN